jgi:hypothetical protein
MLTTMHVQQTMAAAAVTRRACWPFLLMQAVSDCLSYPWQYGRQRLKWSPAKGVLVTLRHTLNTYRRKRPSQSEHMCNYVTSGGCVCQYYTCVDAGWPPGLCPPLRVMRQDSGLTGCGEHFGVTLAYSTLFLGGVYDGTNLEGFQLFFQTSVHATLLRPSY